MKNRVKCPSRNSDRSGSLINMDIHLFFMNYYSFYVNPGKLFFSKNLPAHIGIFYIKSNKINDNILSKGNFNKPFQVQIDTIILWKSRWGDNSTRIAHTFWAILIIDIHTTVTNIIVALCVISSIITETVPN